MWWLLTLACSGTALDPGTVPPEPVERSALQAALRFPGPDPEPDPAYGQSWAGPGYQVRPVALDAVPGFRVGGALFTPLEPGPGAVIVAQGHFGEGKSAAEVAEVAHRLAARGTTVLAVDTPGMEEWAGTGRDVHFAEGAHARAWLLAGGTSALALQLAGLRAGVSLLRSLGYEDIVATGASGGAVQSFWLAILEPVVDGVVLAAVPPLPREPRASGCACDQLPGFPGPDAAVVAALPVPSLWLKEVPGDPPAGLPDSARFEVLEGPHSYTEAMQREAIPWIEARLGHTGGPWLDVIPAAPLRTSGSAEERAHIGLFDLSLAPTQAWAPAPWEGVPYEVECRGEGPTVVTLGAAREDRQALRSGGFRVCDLDVPSEETGFEASVGRGLVYADRYAGAVRTAVARTEAVAAWGVGGWGVAVAGAGVPHVLRAPPRRVEDLDLGRDPPWLHVPGLWWGGLPELWSSALAVHDDPEVLVAGIRKGSGLDRAPAPQVEGSTGPGRPEPGSSGD